MITKVSGLDLSITATGVAHTAEQLACTHLVKTKDGTGDHRLLVIKLQVRELVRGSEFVLIEDLLESSLRAGTTGMVHGAVRTMLQEEGIPYGLIPPSSLKKYATGNGNASKSDMAVAAFKRGGVEFTDDNQCDAWWAHAMARDLVGEPLFEMPAVNRESLKKIRQEA